MTPHDRPFLRDPDFELWLGDALEVLPTLPAASAHCIVTSPPYWGLRDYGTATWEGGDPACDHLVRADPKVGTSTLGGSKTTTGHQQEGFRGACPRCGARRVDLQLGLEPTVEEYVGRLVAIMREARRVLRPDGTAWLNLGDSYASRNAWYQDDHVRGRGHRSRPKAPEGIKPKDLIGVPWEVARALRADGWWLRAEVIWHKPNAMPESMRDRPTKAHEQVFLLAASPDYFYDADAISEPAVAESTGNWSRKTHDARAATGRAGTYRREYEPAPTRNARSVWPIITDSYEGAHFAVMPLELAHRCILAGTPAEGACAECGAPRERVVEKGEPQLAANTWSGQGAAQYEDDGMAQRTLEAGSTLKHVVPRQTVGWRDGCSCGAPAVPAVVLDPFCGAATTALAARLAGRRCVGVELSPDYCRLAAERTRQLSLLAR